MLLSLNIKAIGTNSLCSPLNRLLVLMTKFTDCGRILFFSMGILASLSMKTTMGIIWSLQHEPEINLIEDELFPVRTVVWCSRDTYCSTLLVHVAFIIERFLKQSVALLFFSQTEIVLGSFQVVGLAKSMETALKQDWLREASTISQLIFLLSTKLNSRCVFIKLFNILFHYIISQYVVTFNTLQS